MSTMASAPPKAEHEHRERVYIFTLLIGHKVEVQMLDGRAYEGVFHTAKSDEGGLSIALKHARELIKKIDKNSLAEKPRKVIVLNFAEVAQLRAEDVSFSAHDISGADDLRTDEAIGRGRGGAFGRDLTPWMPEPSEMLDSGLLSLEDTGSNWDQFAVNRDKFGVESTFNEELYTTALNKESCNISEHEAARIAREIESQTGSTNYHILEERGGELDADEMDEEDRYSSVIRDPKSAAARAGGAAAPLPLLSAASNGASGAAGGAWQRRPAWGNAGSGVAAVAKSLPSSQHPQQQEQKQQQQPQHAPRSSLTAGLAKAAAVPVPHIQPSPLSEDQFRLETNTVRSHLVGHPNRIKQSGAQLDGRGTSPYGTPKHSPHFPGGSDLMALNLDVSHKSQVDEETKKHFLRYKEDLRKKNEKEEQQRRLDELKSAASKGLSITSAAQQQQQQQQQPGVAVKAAESSSSQQQGQQRLQQQQVGKEGGEEAKPAATKPVSKLNPFAKSFSLNVAAKEFVPSFASGGGSATGGSSAAASAPAAAAAGAPTLQPGALKQQLAPVPVVAAPTPALMPAAAPALVPLAPVAGFVAPAVPAAAVPIGPGAVAAAVPVGPGFMARGGVAGGRGMGGRHAVGIPANPQPAAGGVQPYHNEAMRAPAMASTPPSSNGMGASGGGYPMGNTPPHGATQPYMPPQPSPQQQGLYMQQHGFQKQPQQQPSHRGGGYGPQQGMAPHHHPQQPLQHQQQHPHMHQPAQQQPYNTPSAPDTPQGMSADYPPAHGHPGAQPLHPMQPPQQQPMGPMGPYMPAGHAPPFMQPPVMGHPPPPQYAAASMVPVSAAGMTMPPAGMAAASGAMMMPPMMPAMVPQGMPVPYGAPGYGPMPAGAPMGYGPPMSSMPMMVSAPMHPGSMPMQPMAMQPMPMDGGFGGRGGVGAGGRGRGGGRGQGGGRGAGGRSS